MGQAQPTGPSQVQSPSGGLGKDPGRLVRACGTPCHSTRLARMPRKGDWDAFPGYELWRWVCPATVRCGKLGQTDLLLTG